MIIGNIAVAKREKPLRKVTETVYFYNAKSPKPLDFKGFGEMKKDINFLSKLMSQFGTGTVTEPVQKSHKFKGFEQSINSINLKNK